MSQFDDAYNAAVATPAKTASTFDAAYEQFATVPDKPFSSDLKEVGRQIVAGAVVDVPKMAGQATQAFTPKDSSLHEAGKEMAAAATLREAGWAPDLEGRGSVAEAFIRGGRALAPSLATLAAYLNPAGYATGPAATLALFGGSAYQDEYEKMKAAGATEEDAKNAGLVTAAIQGGGEVVANLLGAKVLGAAGALTSKTMPGVIAEHTATGVLKPLAKSLALAIPGEAATEAAQDVGQALVERSYGLEIDPIGKIIYDSATAAGAMTALLAPFGLAGHYRNASRAKAIDKILADPAAASPEERLSVVRMLANDGEALQLPDVAAWKQEALQDVVAKRPIRRQVGQPDAPQPDPVRTIMQAPSVDQAIDSAADAIDTVTPSKLDAAIASQTASVAPGPTIPPVSTDVSASEMVAPPAQPVTETALPVTFVGVQKVPNGQDFELWTLTQDHPGLTKDSTYSRQTLEAAGIQVPPKPHDFASTQINLPEPIARQVQQLSAQIPDEALAEDGREDQPHITVLYGLEQEDPDAVRKVLAGEGPIQVTVGKLSLFAATDERASDVIKAEVSSPALTRLHDKIKAALPNTQTQPDYRPHITVAYVKPGEGRKFLSMANPLEGQTITLDQVSFMDRNERRVDIPLVQYASTRKAQGIPPTEPLKPSPVPPIGPPVMETPSPPSPSPELGKSASTIPTPKAAAVPGTAFSPVVQSYLDRQPTDMRGYFEGKLKGFTPNAQLDMGQGQILPVRVIDWLDKNRAQVETPSREVRTLNVAARLQAIPGSPLPTYQKTAPVKRTDPAVIQPRHELPAEQSENLAQRAEVAAELVSQGEPGKRVFTDNPNAPGQTVTGIASTYPPFYGPLKMRKDAVLKALEKIQKDKGVDVGPTVEKVKAALLDDAQLDEIVGAFPGLQEEVAKTEVGTEPAEMDSAEVAATQNATDIAIGELDQILTADDRQVVADELGHEAWTEDTAHDFLGRYAEWLQQGARDLGTRLSALFQKVLEAARVGVLSIAVAFNFGAAVEAKPMPVMATPQSVSSAVERQQAKFAGVEASPDVKVVADWVVQNGKQEGKAFILADKNGGFLYAMDKDGTLLAKSPALFGKAKGDTLTEAQQAKDIDSMTAADKITPAGAFKATPDLFDQKYGMTLDFHEGKNVTLSLHRVYLGTPSEQRMERLQSATSEDNRISYGCINALPEFIDQVIVPHFRQGGLVVVLPETSDPKKFFGIVDVTPKTTTVPVKSTPAQPDKAWGVDKYVSLTRKKKKGETPGQLSMLPGEEPTPEEPAIPKAPKPEQAALPMDVPVEVGQKPIIGRDVPQGSPEAPLFSKEAQEEESEQTALTPEVLPPADQLPTTPSKIADERDGTRQLLDVMLGKDKPLPPAGLQDYAREVVRNSNVQRITLVGSVASKGTGQDIDLIYHFRKVGLPVEQDAAEARVEELIEDAPIDLDKYDTFIEADGRYFHVSAGAGRQVIENTAYAKQQQGKPSRTLADKRDMEAESSPASLIATALRTAAETIEGAVRPKEKGLSDVGEELWYNKRNQTGKGLDWNTIKDLNSALKIREVTKAKVWPKPNYEQLITDGMHPFTAHLVKQIYDSLAATPATRTAPTDADLQTYIDAMQQVREAVFGWAKDVQAQRSLLDDLLVQGAAEMGRPMAVNQLMGSARKAILDRVFPPGSDGYHRYRFRNNPEYEHQIRVIGGNKVINALQPSFDEAKRAIKAIKEGWPAQQEAWQRQFDIKEAQAGARTYRGNEMVTLTSNEFYLVRKGTRRIEADRLPTREAAIAKAKELAERKVKPGEEETPLPLDELQRTGPDHRAPDENISPAQLMETFGFRGINFGNWTNQAERQAHVNRAYDAFLDLADILKVPPEALSLNGLLGVAFGAQGSGKAAAHFVPGVNEINLTKTQGAGSLAHEWAHALDHYFAVQAGEQYARGNDPFLTHAARVESATIRPEIIAAFKSIVETMTRRPATPAEMEVQRAERLQKDRKGLDGWLKAMRGRIDKPEHAAILEKWDRRAERIRQGDSGEGYVKAGQSYLLPHVAELRDIYKEATGHLMDMKDAMGINAWAQLVAGGLRTKTEDQKHIPQVATSYVQEAQVKDADKGGKTYWTTPTELFARAFQSYVLDKLATDTRQNDYLTRPQPPLGGLMDKVAKRYPQGEERTKINAAFDTLIEELKTRETDRGIELYQPEEPTEPFNQSSPSDLLLEASTFTPAESVAKAGGHWRYTTIQGTDHPATYPTKAEAVDAATRHQESRLDAISNEAFQRMLLRSNGREVTPLKRESIRLKLRNALRDLDAEKITQADFIQRMDDLYSSLELKHFEKVYAERAERVRGPEIILERLMQAVRRGDLPREQLELAEWFLKGNEHLFEGLGISVRKPDPGQAGAYNPLSRVMTIMKGTQRTDTAVHEMLHHLERLMPQDYQSAIRKEWLARVTKTYETAEGQTKKYLDAVLLANASHKAADWQAAQDFINHGEVPYDLYSLMNASEFWAVNGSGILQRRKTGIWGQIKQWLQEAVERIRGVLGLPSNAPILQALKWLQTESTGKEVSKKMLGSARQLIQPESPAFKKWFGESVVTDTGKPMREGGTPLVVYHGTKSDFDTFDLNKAGSNNDTGMWGTGFYFSPIKKMSAGYGDKFKRVYLSLQNPLVLHANENWPDIVNGPYVPHETHGEEGKQYSESMRKKLIDAGYDGVIQYERHFTGRMVMPSEKISQVVAFHPEQIKSATGNRGTFDPENPSILAQPEGPRGKVDPIGLGSDELPYRAKAPNVNWSERDLLDTEKRVTEATILKDYGPKNGKAVVYQAWIPTEDMPSERLIEEEDAEAGEETGGYDWDEMRMGRNASYPPAKIKVRADGELEIIDGNHRIRFWSESGMAYIPAWVIDYRQGATAERPDDTHYPSLEGARQQDFIVPATAAVRGMDRMGTLTDSQQAALRHIHGEPATWKTRLNEFTTDWKRTLIQGIFDQYAPILAYSKKGYLLARMAKGGEGTLEALLLYGKPYVDADGAYRVEYSKDTGMNGFGKVLGKLQGEGDRFLEWVAAQRAERLKGIGLEHLYRDADIEALKTLNEGKMPNGGSRKEAYAAALLQLNDWNAAMVKIAVDSKLIDAETAKLYKDTPYVPFYRLQEEGVVSGFGMKAGLVNQYAWKKLKGGTNHLNDDLLANLLQNWSHLITASAKNRAAKATLEAAVEARVAHEVPSGTPGKGLVGFRDDVTKDGKTVNTERVFLVDDPALLDAVAALHYAGLGSVGKPFITAKRWLTTAVTVNPAFKIRNLIRDSIQAIGTAELSYNPLRNIAQGFKATAIDSETRAQLLAGGGMIRFGSMLDGNNADRTRRLVEQGADPDTILDDAGKVQRFWKSKLLPAFEAYQEFGDRGEQISRAALYEQLLAKGLSHQEASFLARDLLDFSLSGKWEAVRILTQIVPFMNARLQGIYKLGRATRADYRRMGTTLGAVALASIGLLLAYDDDDDWKKREDWDRDNFWWFKVGGIAFRLPKPFEIGALGTLAERSVEYLISDEMTGERFGKRISATIFSQLSMNPTPQLVKPLMDLYANKDAFTGRPIETMGMERLRKEDRYTERTSEIAKFMGSLGLPDPTQLAMGQWNTLSPVQIDALVHGYFSWLGHTTTTILDYGLRPMMNRGERPNMRLKEVFLAGNFLETLPTNQSRYVTELYEQAAEIEQAYGSYRDALKRGDREEAQAILAEERDKIRKYPRVEAIKLQERELNAQIRRVEASRTLTGAEKRLKLDALQTRKHQVAQRLAVSP